MFGSRPDGRYIKMFVCIRYIGALDRGLELRKVGSDLKAVETSRVSALLLL